MSYTLTINTKNHGDLIMVSNGAEEAKLTASFNYETIFNNLFEHENKKGIFIFEGMDVFESLSFINDALKTLEYIRQTKPSANIEEAFEGNVYVFLTEMKKLVNTVMSEYPTVEMTWEVEY